MAGRGVIRRALLASTALAAMTTPALADPFSLTALVAGAIASATGLGVAASTIAATIAIGAVTIGAGILLTALFTNVPKPENGTIPVQQPISYRGYLYGEGRIPGSIMHKEESSGYLGVVLALLGHKATAFIGLYLNDDLVNVPIAGGLIAGNVARMTSAPGASNNDARYKDNTITIDTRLGGTGGAPFAIMTGRFPDTWPMSAVGNSIASLAMICGGVKQKDFSTIYPYVAPQPSVVMQGYAVFDPRDSSQSPTDPTTWAYSDNPVLCLLHFRCFSAFGSLLPYATAIAPVLANWIQAANDCDDLVPLKAGGTEKRYRMGGYNTTQQNRRSTVQAMLAACDGWICDRGDGTVDIKVGKYVASTVTITDDDIVGYTIARDTPQKDKVNRITAKYTSPANGFITVETQPLDDTADQALRFGPPRALQMDLTWCQSTGQASRLQKREFIRQGRKTRGTLILKLSGINAAYERWPLVNSNTIPRLAGVVIEPSRPMIDIATGRVTMSFINSGPDIDTYTAATDESPAPYVPQRPVSVGLPIPSNLTAVAQETTSGSSTTVFIELSWDTPLNNGNPWTSLTYVVQYRIAASGSTPAGSWITSAPDTISTSGRTYAATGAVPVGVTLDTQVFSGGGAGQQSDGSDIVQVSTTLVAPNTPSDISATGSSGQAALSVMAPTSENIAFIQFYRTVSGGSFASSSTVGQPVAATSGATVTYTDMVGAGAYDYFAVAIGSNGATSTPDGPASATVT